jgi:hypothetical protein
MSNGPRSEALGLAMGAERAHLGVGYLVAKERIRGCRGFGAGGGILQGEGWGCKGIVWILYGFGKLGKCF